MIETRGIAKNYGSKEVLSGVDFSISAGKICGLLGLNGAGKSTLMKILCGLCGANAGEVFIDNVCIDVLHPPKNVGTMIESPDFYGSLTGWQNLDLFRVLCPEIMPERVAEVLKITGLTASAHVKYKAYSQGMKQRLYFAFALMKNPQVLILDEPFSNIDPVSVKLFEDIIKSMAAIGKTILISGHIIAEIKQICNSAMILDGGKIITYFDSLDGIDLQEAFLSTVKTSGDVL